MEVYTTIFSKRIWVYIIIIICMISCRNINGSIQDQNTRSKVSYSPLSILMLEMDRDTGTGQPPYNLTLRLENFTSDTVYYPEGYLEVLDEEGIGIATLLFTKDSETLYFTKVIAFIGDDTFESVVKFLIPPNEERASTISCFFRSKLPPITISRNNTLLPDIFTNNWHYKKRFTKKPQELNITKQKKRNYSDIVVRPYGICLYKTDDTTYKMAFGDYYRSQSKDTLECLSGNIFLITENDTIVRILFRKAIENNWMVSTMICNGDTVSVTENSFPIMPFEMAIDAGYIFPCKSSRVKLYDKLQRLPDNFTTAWQYVPINEYSPNTTKVR